MQALINPYDVIQIYISVFTCFYIEIHLYEFPYLFTFLFNFPIYLMSY